MALHLLCAGAVKGLVLALQPGFEAAPGGGELSAQFGAVGAMRDALRQGADCDVLVLSEAMLVELEARGEAVPGTRLAIGRVDTGVAVIEGATLPPIDDAGSLRATLLGASALYFPDAKRSTAGAHVASVLGRLGIADEMAPRSRMFPNGATAMGALAASADASALGCTQVTEIRYTPGLALVGALAGEFALATVYSAAVAAGAGEPERARRFIALLAGRESRGLRLAGGFDADAHR